MFGLLASLALAIAPASPDDAASKELAALAQRVKDAESYSFTFLPARLEKENEKEKDATAWKVEIKKKLPYHYQRGEVEFFKLDEKYVLKGSDGKWSLADPAKRAGGPAPSVGGTTDPKGGDDGGDGKQPGPGKKGGARRSGLDRIVAATEGIPLPHRLFNDFDAKFAEVTKEEKEGRSIYHAKLKPAFVRELLNSRGGRPGGRAGGGGEGKGEGKPAGGGAEGGDAAAPKHDVEATGSMNVTAKGEVIEAIDFDVAIKLPSTDRKGGGTITLSNLNATNLVLPKEVETALGLGAAPEKK